MGLRESFLEQEKRGHRNMVFRSTIPPSDVNTSKVKKYLVVAHLVAGLGVVARLCMSMTRDGRWLANFFMYVTVGILPIMLYLDHLMRTYSPSPHFTAFSLLLVACQVVMLELGKEQIVSKLSELIATFNQIVSKLSELIATFNRDPQDGEE